ncbi:MAG TPA: heavy-metal-associated domain-containing protein [Solirubrobacteraceae bacterium]|nr:heavy-metal-associated domain-containing protein [Solirubrobacteraceae bacterium]
MSTIDRTTVRPYTVTGMTCAHCVMSVREEVSEVPGVTGVDVDLASGRMTVSGEGFSDEAVENAVAEAGYEVAR